MITYTYSVRIYRFEVSTEGRVVQFGVRDTLEEVHTEVSFWLKRNNRTMKLWSEFVSSQCTDRDWRPMSRNEERLYYAGTLNAPEADVRLTDKGLIVRRK